MTVSAPTMERKDSNLGKSRKHASPTENRKMLLLLKLAIPVAAIVISVTLASLVTSLADHCMPPLVKSTTMVFAPSTTAIPSNDAPLLEDELQPWKSQYRGHACASSTTDATDGGWVDVSRLGRTDFVILTNFNCEYIPFALNLYRAYRELGYSNMIFIAEDCKGYDIMAATIGPEHVAPPLQPGRGAAEKYGSVGFKNVTRMRPAYIHYFLNRGLAVLWQDIDSVPLQDLMPFFPRGYDVVVVNDKSSDLFLSWGINYCTGLLYMTPTPRAFKLIHRWIKEMPDSEHDQVAFNIAILKMIGKEEINFVELPRAVFPNGADFDKYNATAAWMHANFRIGLEKKKKFMANRNQWRPWVMNLTCSSSNGNGGVGFGLKVGGGVKKQYSS